MIGYLSGKLLRIGDQDITLDVGGVGYEVFVGKTTAGMLGREGNTVPLWIHTHVREDQISLFGFRTVQQRSLFQTLLTVSGVGPKLAHAMVDQFDAGQLIEAITLGDSRQLQAVPGIGRKMAERMILELKERISVSWRDLAPGPSTDRVRVWEDLVQALTGLGFPDVKIRNVVRLLKKERQDDGLGLDEILKQALQKINQC